MNLKLRLATMADIPALEKLIRQSVANLSAEFYTTVQIESALSHIFGVDTQLISDGTYFMAESGERLAGSGGWSKRKTLFGGDRSKPVQADVLLDPLFDAARLRAFYVHPECSRRGVGSRILSACEDAARAAGFQRIELVATLPGERLYSARGYVRVEALGLPMANGESLPAFLMTKPL
jgi:N-acetylglutamate synthase-like GNAT family acetyltransferase